MPTDLVERVARAIAGAEPDSFDEAIGRAAILATLRGIRPKDDDTITNIVVCGFLDPLISELEAE